jgi:hypothetical protein
LEYVHCIIWFAVFEAILEKVLQYTVPEELQFVFCVVGRVFLEPQCFAAVYLVMLSVTEAI